MKTILMRLRCFFARCCFCGCYCCLVSHRSPWSTYKIYKRNFSKQKKKKTQSTSPQNFPNHCNAKAVSNVKRTKLKIENSDLIPFDRRLFWLSTRPTVETKRRRWRKEKIQNTSRNGLCENRARTVVNMLCYSKVAINVQITENTNRLIFDCYR